MEALIITADDYGYAPAYDRGILEAVQAGVVDAVSVMTARPGFDPWELALGEGGADGVVEWMTHPGHPDASVGSSYDQGRAEDLRLVLGLAQEPAITLLRTTHAALPARA